MQLSELEKFPALRGLDGAALALIAAEGTLVSIPVGAKAFEVGAQCRHYLVVAAGTVRVQLLSAGGREITLYRVAGGETCVLTMASLMTHAPYAAEGICETDVTAIALPEAAFSRLLAESKPFRDFAFMAHATRITDLMARMEEVAFGRIDIRLARRLLDLADGKGRVQATHQELAVELGTAREVISRQLMEFSRAGLITLGRGHVDLVDREELARVRARPAR